MGPVLTTMCCRDERAVSAGAGEHDVARLIADEQRARHLGNATGQINDADAVREMVDHPDLIVGPRGDRNRLHAHGHRRRKGEPPDPHVEDLERVVGCVHNKELASIR